MGAPAVSQTVEPAPVLRLCSCLTAEPELLSTVESELARNYGEVALKSPAFPFDTSDYYREEMGDGLERHWLCFRELFGAERLPEYRLTTGRIEARLTAAGDRRVNLDPGYLDLGKLVLASLKEAPDKIYMGQGVWAHTCLKFRQGEFTAPDHSFPDFRDGRFDAFMLEARNFYKSLLQGR
jgi:hypothetical protein